MPQEPKLRWWKWRSRSSAGLGTWEFIQSYAENAEELGTELDRRSLLNSWSEHFRGIDAVKVARPPLKVLDADISSKAYDIEEAQREFKSLVAM